MRKTLAAKMIGGWLLDRLTAEREIELGMFLCTSSIASVWGSVAQGAYAAANAFLDALSQQRVASGRAATTVNFGPWSGVGMGAANEEGVAWLRSRGIRALEPGFALDGMETAVAGGLSEAVVVDVNWLTFRELAELQKPRPLLEKLGKPGTVKEEAVSDEETTLLKELADATPDQRLELLRQVVKVDLARILQKPVQELDNEVGFFDLGMDSLMAVEFSKALSARLGQKLSATVVMDRPDVETLTVYIIDEILKLSAGTQEKDKQQRMPDTDETELEVDTLSDGEVESALDDELKEILG